MRKLGAVHIVKYVSRSIVIMSKLLWTLGLLAILAVVPSVNALSTGTSSSSSSSLFGAFTIGSQSTPIYAALFALVIFVIFYQMLQRTTLGGGAAAIAFVFAAITFVFLYTNSSYLSLFLTVSVMAAVMAILLIVLLIPTRRGGSAFSRVVGLILLAVLFYLLLSNNSSLASSVDNALHVNVLGILPLIIVGALVVGVIVLLIRAFRSTTHPGLKAIIPILILGLIIFFFVPGAGAFLLSPLSLIFYGLVFVGIIVWYIFAHGKSTNVVREKGTSGIKIEHLPPPAPRSTRGPIKEWLPPPALKSDKGPLKEWTPPAKEKTGFWGGSGKGTTKLKDLDLKGKRIEVDKGGKTIFRWKAGDKKDRGGHFVDSEDYKK